MLAVTVAGLCACSMSLDDIGWIAKTGTVRSATLQHMQNLDIDRAAPILIRIYKEERTLEVWKQNRTGTFALLKAYPICNFSGKLGPKLTEGDRQAPEGFYDITPNKMNPLSREYLAFNIGFPNAFDRSLRRTGSVLMVHGGCKSIGCYAMTDYQMEEVYGLLDEAFKGGQNKIQLEAFPFRMTEQNLARHAGDRNAPFWQMLKAGSDAFLAAGQPPTITVCGRHYVFNPLVTNKVLDPSAPCPPGIDQSILAGGVASPASKPDAIAQKTNIKFRAASLRAGTPQDGTLKESRAARSGAPAPCRSTRNNPCAATSHLQGSTFRRHEWTLSRANRDRRISATASRRRS
jgi:murein L,D-transpeptidase YafK